jgi:hypothetical protein
MQELSFYGGYIVDKLSLLELRPVRWPGMRYGWAVASSIFAVAQAFERVEKCRLRLFPDQPRRAIRISIPSYDHLLVLK